MSFKFGYTVPSNTKIFKSNFNYFNEIGTFSKEECIKRSLLVSGVLLVDESEFQNFVKHHHLEDIFLKS
jgi:hypothetical protein